MIDSFEPYLAPTQIKLPPVPAAGASKTDIRKAAEDFEAMFVAEMMRPIFETTNIEDDPFIGGGHGEEMFKSLLVDEYGKSVSASGGIGIADMVEKELLKLQEAK